MERWRRWRHGMRRNLSAAYRADLGPVRQERLAPRTPRKRVLGWNLMRLLVGVADPTHRCTERNEHPARRATRKHQVGHPEASLRCLEGAVIDRGPGRSRSCSGSVSGEPQRVLPPHRARWCVRRRGGPAGVRAPPDATSTGVVTILDRTCPGSRVGSPTSRATAARMRASTCSHRGCQGATEPSSTPPPHGSTRGRWAATSPIRRAITVLPATSPTRAAPSSVRAHHARSGVEGSRLR